jgi:predicted amidohydrolase
MSRNLTTGLVQFTPKMGDIAANLEKIIDLTGEAARQGAQMIIFPELAMTGYNQDILGDENLYKLALTV